MNTEEFIRSRAALNWSRAMVAAALGMNPQKFSAMVGEHMPDVKWCGIGKSVDWIRSREERRGHCTPGLARSCSRAREERMKRQKLYTVGCFTGRIREVYDHWEELTSVSHSQVRRRLKAGVNILDALFKPNETHLGWGQNRELFKRECNRIFGRVSGSVQQPVAGARVRA